MTVDITIQEFCDKGNFTRSAISSLLTATSWPSQSEQAADSLLKTLNDLPDIPSSASGASFILTLSESIRVLEAAHTKVKQVSEKYGSRKSGLLDVIKDRLAPRRRRRCTDTLWGCRGEIEGISTKLRGCLSAISTNGNTGTGPVQGSDTPSGIPPQSSIRPVETDHNAELLGPLQTPKTDNVQTRAPEHPTSEPPSLQDSPPGLADNGDKPRLIRDGGLTAARKTFKVIEALSGLIPGFGDFVGAGAKIGLGFVKMIETMDKNQDISQELVSHTSKLSACLEHFKKALAVEKGDEFVTHVEDLHKELECAQQKVKEWDSSGRLKKALLSSDHAEDLKAQQDTVEAVLKHMKARLLVDLKTTDLVRKLMDVELGAERRRLLDRLGDGSYGARGSAMEEVVCLPGTRLEILNRINEWIKDTSPSAERVLWIRGMAGRGKSTIASTVQRDWASRSSCAIFHFRRGQNELDSQFVCALARQLGKGWDLEVKNAILISIKENEDIAKERLEQQFKALMVGAFGKLQNNAHPIVIIVDALDECKNVNDAVRFVRLIGQHSKSLPANVKFLLTCRPEPPLVLALKLRKWRSEDLDLISHVAEDIKRFIQHSCTQIREEHDLPQSWPLPTDLEAIVEMSQGLFQWARTAMAYISHRAPDNRLQELLQHPTRWGGLDELYHQILSRAFDELEKNSMRKQMLSWALGTLVVAPYPVTLEVIAFLHTDHEIFMGQENIVNFLRKDILADLNSLLHIPQTLFEPVRLMHTSIRDLLTAQVRCQNQPYFVDAAQNHRRLAGVSLQIMWRDLKPNICNLLNVPYANPTVQDAVDTQVANGLRYCCRSWCTHLTGGVKWSEATVEATSVLDEFKRFSDNKLISWLEVMSLIRAIPEAYTMAKQVHLWLVERPLDRSNDLNTLWNDTRRFIAAFFESISYNAHDIYALALPRCPVETELWLKYRDQALAWFLVGKRERNWPANIWTASANSSINALAFTPDGSAVVSGSSEDRVQLWDAQTGAPLGDPLIGHSWFTLCNAFSPDGNLLALSVGEKAQLRHARTGTVLGDTLRGHTESITSVALSPDSKVLASGSRDQTIRLWNVETGEPLSDPLAGHNGWITSVAFSADDKVASGSEDNTVRLWDARTGAPLGDPLTGHSKPIMSVAFSPDGKILASGSQDTKIRLWDTQTGTSLGGPLTGHSHFVTSVAFSPDGKALASGSRDKTVRLWDGQTGASLGDPLAGHSKSITSIVFSPDSKVLASGSLDETVRLWDAQNAARLGDSLTGHSDSITSVMFSPDGKVLASDSLDKTVRLWDARTGAPMSDSLAGHSDAIMSLTFSPNGEVLASGSLDNTVRLWDAQNGAPLGQPLTGHDDSITSVAFSPDGKILASGSDDKTVRLWDARKTGPLGDPLMGHCDSITFVVFSSDGKLLASVSEDTTIRLWDGQTGASLGDPLAGHRNSITSIVFSPGGKVLASGSLDRTVRLWDPQNVAQLGDPLAGHSGWITSIAFSPDGKVLASGSYDHTIRLWDVQSGALLGYPLIGHSDSITTVVFSWDAQSLASGSMDGTVGLWDVRSGAPLGDPLTGCRGSIMSVAFSLDGKGLTSVSSGGMVRFWMPVTLKSATIFRPCNFWTCSG